MTVLMFMDRFAPLVRDGSKPHTIRGQRKRPIKAGDWLSLRRWTGRAYGSPQEVLREATCLSVEPITINALDIVLNGKALSDEQCEKIARGDGFADAREMVDWFGKIHGLSFSGTLICWTPTPTTQGRADAAPR